ncbi:uncharacterized protein APUU_30732S [Aspergillus puulaauensis]|uniref:Uncharacterized protein n=1 Tax=Aspergillus puulaauensis TaxID=1220207 RepID=A0A7R7XJ71_9EURO|nr:uncharacterized protein APUU_30732S [Aspergillus puulaauensis]BCS22507.1 hypothetical protein APUU_30732S [Aspergillus puulaauensis]
MQTPPTITVTPNGTDNNRNPQPLPNWIFFSAGLPSPHPPHQSLGILDNGPGSEKLPLEIGYGPVLGCGLPLPRVVIISPNLGPNGKWEAGSGRITREQLLMCCQKGSGPAPALGEQACGVWGVRKDGVEGEKLMFGPGRVIDVKEDAMVFTVGRKGGRADYLF